MTRDEEICALVASGVSQREAGRRYGLSQQRVSKIVRRVAKRPRAGETITAICARLYISRPTYYAAKRDGRLLVEGGRVVGVRLEQTGRPRGTPKTGGARRKT